MVERGNVIRMLTLMPVLLGVLGAAPVSASLQAYVDHNPVKADESFTLTLENGSDLPGSPDLSVLQRDFEVLGQSKNSSFEMINGAVSSKVQWQISLIPKHSGKITIPAIRLGNQQSPVIALNVTASGAPASGQNSALFLEVKAEPQSAYIQQQIIYTVLLYRAVDIGNGATLSEPNLPDAIIKKLGKDRNYQIQHNGMNYDVIERAYAVYPQKSGKFTISPLTFEGDIVQGGGGFFGMDPFNASTQHKRIHSQPVEITIKPAPEIFKDRYWLPAQRLKLAENWSETPPTFTVGQPITRTLTLTAEGLTAAQLPSLGSKNTPDFKQYPDQPVLKDKTKENGVTGERMESIALIPRQPGSFTLPAIDIPWWNTKTNRIEVASLPARTVDVRAITGAADNATAATPADPVSVSPLQSSSMPEQAVSHATVASISNNEKWRWFALLLGTGWMITLILWAWQARRYRRLRATVTSKDKPLSTLERSIKANCMRNDAAQTKQSLLEWARHCWPDHPPASLSALASRCDKELAEALGMLDQVLYSQAAPSWDGSEFWRHFKAHRPDDKKSHATSRKSALESLYNSTAG